MVNIESVLRRLRQLITLDEDEAENALPLCSVCLEDIAGRLRENADPDDIRIAQAAAALTFYRIVMRNAADGEGLSSFKAGDVTVTHSPAASIEIAVRLRDEALAAAADLIKDDNFLFRQVSS